MSPASWPPSRIEAIRTGPAGRSRLVGLQLLGGVATGQLDKQLDGAAQPQVGESWQHLGAASATG
jgi:hypothetical protein